MTSLDRLPLTRRRLAALGLGGLAASWWPVADAIAGEGRVWTFLVLGLDTREENSDQRSDVMMLSRVNSATGTVRTLSIPRDLWVEIPGHGQHKVNAAFQIGLAASEDLDWEAAADLTKATLEANLGVTVDGTALTDLNRFPAVIDAVGGIEVDNPYELVDPGDGRVNFPAGIIQLDGEQALVFSTSRNVDTDDGRVMRQHLVLEGLLRRLQEPDILASLPELIASLRGLVRSDIGVATQLQLMSLLPDISADDLVFTNIADQCWADWSDDGQWIYQADWTTLPQYVQDWLDGVAG